jgi:hypothetical protein
MISPLAPTARAAVIASATMLAASRDEPALPARNLVAAITGAACGVPATIVATSPAGLDPTEPGTWPLPRTCWYSSASRMTGSKPA